MQRFQVLDHKSTSRVEPPPIFEGRNEVQRIDEDTILCDDRHDNRRVGFIHV